MEFAEDVPNAGDDEQNIDEVLNSLGRLYLIGKLDPYAEYESWEVVEDVLYKAAEAHENIDGWSAQDLSYAFHRKTGTEAPQGFHPNSDLPILFAAYVDKMRESWVAQQTSTTARTGGGFRGRMNRR